MNRDSSSAAFHRKGLFSKLTLGLTLALMLILTGCTSNTDSVLHTSRTTGEATEAKTVRVPWDYKIVEGSVGDLIDSDMMVLPEYQLMTNDGNYATGDKVWLLQFMDAEMATDNNQRNKVRLSSWSTIKTYKTQDAATKDMNNLKIAVTTDVDLVGVYKTEFKGETRNFAVVELPSGNRVKQPIDDKRYKEIEKKKTVSVQLEEIHDYADYDLAYAKFRGWAK
ncbi:signal peptide protein [Paenibacillus sp. L3-i20]|uniref:signal peptide protein n=1 Tax=Paenibacillus sp. L3-i20 TaxID=2905833 RepID=UPI0035CCEC41